ncbi:T9SS type A sorting domain-containing protein [Mucilaginibacter sp. HMF5004]|uniref:GDSL-type esterase/lipase family protein n=1 Tax=Mucilaginibacter rivuli TaxID=2857527 RepID=UPI001C5E157A|nr:GDSL-type esterase/lipase family protein [Mucilaginibacter rivuli]MBW4889936.1 T9SS type A sorting domain-containing protein [Mucilaginibacter rivuli]
MHYRKIILLLAFACFGTFKGFSQTPSCSAASKFYIKDTINVTTFGASTVQGIAGFTFQPYLQQNFQYCYVGKQVSITNNGISGETTTQGLARFESAINGRTGFVFILMGINDAIQLISQKVPPTPAQLNASYKLTIQNMQKMVDIAARHGLTTVIGSLQNLDPTKGIYYKTINKQIALINAGYKKLAAQNHIYFADINAGLGNDFKKYYQADGIHPNAAGNKFIAYILFDVINFAIESKLLLIGLDQNFPNPANTKTTIGFSMSQAGSVDIELYSITGALTKTITQSAYNSGYHQVVVDLTNVSPGIYIYVMNIAGRQLSKKMIVVK